MASRGLASRGPHYETENTLQWNDNINGELKLKPRDLSIVWGNDKRYWRIPNPQEDSAAELLQVKWLEVKGIVLNLIRGKSYEIGFNVSLTPDAFGWSGLQVYIVAKIGKRGRYTYIRQYVTNPSDEVTTPFDIPYPSSNGLKINIPPEKNEDVYFGLYEVWSGRWKGGLQLHHAFVREITNVAMN